MIKAVIFDMDGVLVDTEPIYYERLLRFLEHHEVETDEKELKKTVGLTSGDTWKWIEKVWGKGSIQDDYDTAYHSFYKDEPIPYAKILDREIFEVLDWLKQEEYKVGLASSSSFKNIQSVLEECALTGYFETILSGEMFEQSKPHPEIYLKSAEKLAVRPQECLAVEDSTFGIQAGKAAEMFVLAKEDNRFNFQQDLADKKIKSLKEIMQELK